MNRRDFIKTTGLAIAAATLPIPALNIATPYPDALDFTGFDFDRFLAEDCAKPDVVICSQETFDELMADYPEWANMRREQFQ
jgi:hypothetical protein